MRDPQLRRLINVIRKKTVICQLCSKSGHDAKACRNGNSSKPPLICQWCDRQGHSVNNCWKKQNEQHIIGDKPRIICQNCNNLGHTAKDCRSGIKIRARTIHHSVGTVRSKGIFSKTVNYTSQVIIEEWQKTR
ncbi:hypothetical protein P5V15_010296 [Pogonomyrmex californicus]